MNTVHKERIGRVCGYMREAGLSQILVSSTSSVYYLTGLWIEPLERMLALALRENGEMALFGNAMFGIACDGTFPLNLHKDGDDPVKGLAEFVMPGKLGIDKFWYSKFLIGLMSLRPDIVPVDGSAPVDMARRLKDKAERAAMRHSSAMNDLVMSAAIAALGEGARETEIARLVNREYLARGADCEGTQLVCFGYNGADPHHAPDSTVLKPGDGVVLDIFAPIGRYWCDMTRTVFYQSVGEKQREVYELVRRANEAAIAEVGPGIPVSHLDNTARGVITAGGYGPNFTHRLGHGCGLECHEPPDVSGASGAVLEPGMVFSIEPGVYIPGEFGVRIEDLVLVTEDGCVVLNNFPKDLRVIE